MKQIIIMLLLLTVVTTSSAEDGSNSLFTKPRIFTGTDTIDGTSNDYTTSWMQVGFATDGDDNDNIRDYNPNHFTVAIKLASVQGDTAQLSDAYFEQTFDTTGTAYWNADSSNVFIESGRYIHAQYGNWRFEPFDDTNRYYLFPLRLFVGGYVRLNFATTVDDTFEVDWELICEH